MRNRAGSWLLICVCTTISMGQTPQAPPAAEASPEIAIDQIQIDCRIDGRQLAVTVGFEATTKQPSQRLAIIRGDAVLDKLDPALTDGRLDYDPNDKAYYVAWPQAGRHRIGATFMAQSATEPDGSWRRVSLQTPGGRVRQIRLVAGLPDLEVQLPGALRLQRRVEQGQLVVEAMLGPREPLEIRWKPQVQLADAKLVLASQANTVVDVRPGLMQIDSLYDFEIAQGKLETLVFAVPGNLRITAVNGSFIRTWALGDSTTDQARSLRVDLSRAQDREYRLQIRAEAVIETLPATVDVPAIEPTGDIRAAGCLAVGTNSALQLVVQESSGLTQVDAAAFPHVQTQDVQTRAVPQGKAFFYSHAGGRYRLRLTVDDIVPTYDVASRLVARVKEDDLLVDAELELDVRDAPLRQLEIAAPAGLTIAAVDGNQVEDYRLPETPAAGQATSVRVVFKEPVIGRTLLHLRLELGRGPLGERQNIPALSVAGAKTQRGYVVIAADPGIEIEQPQMQNLREVHTASVPLRVPQAQYAYRFRDTDWTLSLMAQRRPAEIRAEIFHLHSIGDALAYGSAVINYVITGSPVDELQFRLPSDCDAVEFAGRDVRRWVKQGDAWVVKLTRKVLGDYSVAVTYTQRYGPDRPIQLGALVATDAQTQTGYVVVTSYLDLRLQLTPDSPGGQNGLLPIALDELPADYRLLTSSPVLSAYKYVTEPHTAMLAIDPYQRSGLLPVVVDIADLQTKLAVRPDGRIESMTTVRYKVKNTTGQFLALTMPADTRVWTVSQIESYPGAPEQATRVAASHDEKSGQLLVPLKRQANPNDPATLELQYGQLHPAGGWWRRTLDLEAPRCMVPTAYADWQIIVPDRWAIARVGGDMHVESRAQSLPGLAGVADRVASLWAGALDRMMTDGMFWAFAALLAAIVLVYAIIRRRYLPHVILLAVLALVLRIGIAAASVSVPPLATQDSAPLHCTQAVSVDPSQALHISAALVPAWRQAVRVSDLLGVLVVVIVASATAIMWRRMRLIALAAVVAALLYIAARIPITLPMLKASLTWLPPVIVAAWLVIRSRRRRPIPAGAVAVASILLVLCASGCSGALSGSRAIAGRSAIEQIECSLTAGADSMELKYNLRLVTDGPAKFPLLDESAVLVSPAKPSPHVAVRAEDGRHVVCVDRSGDYGVEVVFLAALPKAGEDQQRRFELSLPPALTNHVSLTIADVNVSVDAPQAVSVAGRQSEGQTRVDAMFAPGRPAVFTWRPLERQAARETVRFYAQDLALAGVSPGLLQVFHEVRLQIAQGQVDRLTLDVAAGQTVTSVDGPQVGAWRFDPAEHRLEVRLSQPATGSYAMSVVTQSASATVPYDIRLEPLIVQQALDQHSVIGVAAEPSVYVRLDQHPAAMNVQDYVREAGQLVKAVSGLAVEQITQAFRFEPQGNAIAGRVQAVQSEIRSQETARFNVEDERLVYNSQWNIEIAKAGRFDVDLLMPEGFDIDALEAQAISHWDESTEAGQRRVRVHFTRRLTGTVPLRLALSQAVAEIPDRLAVPRVTVVGGIKHTGHLLVGSEQGVRVTIAARQGVSEINPAELGESGQGLLAFQFLRPDWQLELQTELIQARVTVQSLHVAKVTDGLVRHQHSLRYRLYHAGTKAFALALPTEAAGVTITGPGIARREQSGPGQWRVELADKVYDQPYLMTVTYETRYNPADGNVPLVPVRCQDADLQQGYTAVFATDRVELAIGSIDAALHPADARSIPAYFGAGDLSAAAMCFRCTAVETQNLASLLTVRARRHAAAEQIGADVRKTDLVSVVTAAGQTINRVALVLRVGTQRHLQTVLPEGASLWSLAVDGQAVQPSLHTTAEGRNALLVPLPQQASEDVLVDLVYVAAVSSPATHGDTGGRWSGRHSLSGPRFDLPLKNITWQVYLPQGFTYGDFGGTMPIDLRTTEAVSVSRYDMQTYQQQIVELNRKNDYVAQEQQSRARELAQRGEQTAARQALTKGYNFSIGNSSLNEDIRVDLDNLLTQQAKVGLINARDRLRQQTGAGQVPSVIPPDRQGFSPQQAERIESSLGQAESENLELITRRIIQSQTAAETPVSQIRVTMPVSGQLLRFDSPLQVEPAAEMSVAFTTRAQHLARVDPSPWYGLGLFVVLLLIGLLVRWMARPWAWLCKVAEASAHPAQQKKTTQSEKSPAADRSDDQGRQVSAEELL